MVTKGQGRATLPPAATIPSQVGERIYDSLQGAENDEISCPSNAAELSAEWICLRIADRESPCYELVWLKSNPY